MGNGDSKKNVSSARLVERFVHILYQVIKIRQEIFCLPELLGVSLTHSTTEVEPRYDDMRQLMSGLLSTSCRIAWTNTG